MFLWYIQMGGVTFCFRTKSKSTAKVIMYHFVHTYGINNEEEEEQEEDRRRIRRIRRIRRTINYIELRRWCSFPISPCHPSGGTPFHKRHKRRRCTRTAARRQRRCLQQSRRRKADLGGGLWGRHWSIGYLQGGAPQWCERWFIIPITIDITP